ncbi:hypothetical protein MMC34_005226 [Xylographa carneopallida]|nr:hypothetical protein [Xylographa carneopallida]
MPLLLQPVVEADMERAVDIQARAFSTEPWDQVMFPNGMSAAGKAIMVERARKDFHNPNVVFMKVVDTDRKDEMISFSRWYIYKQERPNSEWNQLREKKDWGPDANNEALNEFMAAMDDKRKKLMAGEPHCYHQRRNAGALLVQWGTNIADEAGLRCYLEASPAGHHLYHKEGFRDVEPLELNMAKYGKEGASRHMCMIRPAKAA